MNPVTVRSAAHRSREIAPTLRAKAAALVVATFVSLTALASPAFADGLPTTSGGGTAPPGTTGNITTIVSWASWVVFVIAVIGVMFVAVKMILQHHRGEGGQQMASLFYVLGGAIITAAASAVIGALTTAA
jgi:hypothetical protein